MYFRYCYWRNRSLACATFPRSTSSSWLAADFFLSWTNSAPSSSSFSWCGFPCHFFGYLWFSYGTKFYQMISSSRYIHSCNTPQMQSIKEWQHNPRRLEISEIHLTNYTNLKIYCHFSPLYISLVTNFIYKTRNDGPFAHLGSEVWQFYPDKSGWLKRSLLFSGGGRVPPGLLDYHGQPAVARRRRRRHRLRFGERDNKILYFFPEALARHAIYCLLLKFFAPSI